MTLRPLNHCGVSHLIAIVAILVIAAVGATAYFVSQQASTGSKDVSQATAATAKPKTTRKSIYLYFRSGSGDTDSGFVMDYKLSEGVKFPRPTSPGSEHHFVYRLHIAEVRSNGQIVHLTGAKVKLSTVDLDRDGKRNKKYGCGFNGLNKNRDSNTSTNDQGLARFTDCTRGIFRIKVSNIGRYKTYKLHSADEDANHVRFVRTLYLMVYR